MLTDSHPIELLTRDELMQMLKISKAGVYRLVGKRQIPFYKVGGTLRFDRRDIIEYLQCNRIEPVQYVKNT